VRSMRVAGRRSSRRRVASRAAFRRCRFRGLRGEVEEAVEDEDFDFVG